MKKFFFLIILISLSSCSALKTASISDNSVENKINLYIKKFAPAAVKNMRFYRIPASITLAQGVLESGYGEGTLAKKQIIILELNVIKDGKVSLLDMMMMKKTNVSDLIRIH